MTAKVRLEADPAVLARFVEATFRYADDGTDAVLRTFVEGSNEVLGTVRVPLNGAGLDPLIEHAAHQATKAANTARPAVFAPPVATFIGGRTRERDLGNGLVLTVEADQAPTIARRNLQFVLGPPTLVVASGGYWTDPESGEVEEKLHLHWRCREPSRTIAEHALLKRARALACRFVGADATAITPAHPLRWPGSWHRKHEPRLARIVDLRPDVEIEPSEVVELLEPLIPVQRAGGRRRVGAQHDSELDDGDLATLGEIIANPDREWADWNRLGMAFFAASNGSEASFAAFDQVSQRSTKYDASDTRRRWEHFHQSPPHRLGPGTLIYEARQVDPAFRLQPKQPLRPAANGAPPSIGAADEGAAGPDEQACEWRPRLLRNDKGSARDCVANAVLILRSDARFIGRLRLDKLHQATFTRDLPWDRSSTWRPWSDVDDIELAHWCQLRGVMHDAAKDFQADFIVASLDALRALPVLRVPGTGREPDQGERQLHAKRRVHEAMQALGGLSSPAGSCVWHVVGLQRSVREWAIRQGWGGRPVRQEQAQGILVAALGMLAAQSRYALAG
jgi:Primase C terminal 2 (PriCT-2)